MSVKTALKRANTMIYYYAKPHYPNLVVPEKMSFTTYWKKWYFLISEYNKLGLYHDDLIYEWPDVQEAVRRLPRVLKEERDWRMIRSIQLDLNHELLPEDQWTQYEDDITKGRYLTPYLEEVRKEIKERDAWNSIY